MKVGELVRHLEKIYEVSSVKTNSKGVWVRLSSSPESSLASPCTGIAAECWFLDTSLELIEEDVKS